MIAQDFQHGPFQPAPTAPAVTAPPQQPRKRPVLRAAMITSIFLLGSIAGGTAGAAVLTRAQTPTVTTASSSTGTSLNVAAGSVAALYSQAVPGVVTITTQVTSQFGQTGQGTGSGIVVDTQGHILTNAHVVSGAQQIQVNFSDGRTVTATLAGIDTTADLAVIKVSVAASSLHPLTLGNSNSVQVGDSVYAIGAPFGLSGSLSAGVVSALNRSNPASGGASLSHLIQTDAAINPGDSGGPLLNAQGQVIGINDSIESPVDGNVGVGFAISINQATQLLPALEKGLNQ